MNDDTKNNSEENSNTPTSELTDQTRILVVDDDRLIRELVVAKLTKAGYKLLATADGAEAMTFLRDFKPDVVVLDINLPGVRGDEILKEIKQDESFKHIPVIVFTNNSKEADKQMMMDLGAHDFLFKAMTNLNQLVDSVEKVIKS